MSDDKVPKVDDVAFGEMDFRMPARRRIEEGEVVEGVVVSVSDSDVFVDVGTKSEAVIDIKEVSDAEGNLSVKVGDQIQAYVISLDPELVLSYALGRAHVNLQRLQDAYDMGMPVEGKVAGVNKGGLEVEIGGTRAFCPVSQIDLGYCEEPGAFVGQTLSFRITRFDEEGRNIVVSRRALLQEEQEEAAEATRAQLQEGAEFWGEVKTLQPYGAFVDIGGVQGMVHISEISHSRIEHPSDALEAGQRVRVRVTKIDRDPKHPERERIGLSMRALLGDPWDEGTQDLDEGVSVRGKIVRIQPFGAFVELCPGVDGLIHISELSDRRIKHPSDVVSVGQEVEATVLKVDQQARRISLSLRGPEQGSGEQLSVGELVEVVVDRVKPFGLLVRIKGAGRKARGLIPAEETGTGRQANLRRTFPEGSELKAMVLAIEPESGKLRLSLTAVVDQAERESYSQYVGGSDQGAARAGSSTASMGTLADKLMQALNKKK